MELGLAGKSAVVLASSSGLGLGVAEALLAEGASVALSGRDTGRLNSVAARLGRAHGERVLAQPLDVRDREALVAHLEHVRKHWGAVHILVTNSGGPPPSRASEMTREQLQAAVALLFEPALTAIGTVLPWMREQKWGRIVALTSSSVRQPIPGLALSNTVRAGLTGYLKTLSCEVASDGVLVNSICTGLFATERLRELFEARAKTSGRSVEEERRAAEREIPVGRLGTAEEFGAVAAFLCSERASFVNGVALPIDGGMSRSLL
jgi:3-oxoacyl-[acyl-carrier protein] reductase